MCNILVHSSQMIAAQGQEQSSSCSYFKKRNIIAETKNWHAIYCLFISDSCFQLLHADRKFWSHRYLFLHLCTHISGNTGYSEREIFLPDRKNKNSFKELIAMKGPVESDAKKCAGDNSGSNWINRISLFPVPLNPYPLHIKKKLSVRHKHNDTPCIFSVDAGDQRASIGNITRLTL